jgi:hypothetical protein
MTAVVPVKRTFPGSTAMSAASDVRMEVTVTKRLVPVNALGSIQEVIVKSVR